MKSIRDYAELVVKLFPLLTGITFVFGYIGFHTFTAIYHLPVITTDISIIVGIGLLNLTYIAILYYTASRKRIPFAFEAFAIYWVFNLLLHSPVAMAGSIVTVLMYYQLIAQRNPKKITYAKLRIKAKKRFLNNLRYDMIFSVLALIVSFLLDEDFYFLVLAIYGLLFLIHKYKRNTQRSVFLTMIILLSFPMMTMYYFINSSEVNVLGLNNHRIEIRTKTDTLKTRFIFTDDSFYYCYNDSTKQVTSIQKSDIIQVKTISEKKLRKSGYTAIKESFSK
jgi:hypothetical protein